MINVLVVDDSRVMTKIVTRILEKDPLIRVIGTAGNGYEALEKIEKLKPGVVTLDVEMPRMDGIETLKRIMAANPLPVIMLSTLTRDHADITMEALNIGACDFVTKDFSNATFAEKEQELIGKVKDVAKNRARLMLMKGHNVHNPARPLSFIPRASAKRDILSIGASTGGPPALQYILSHLPKDFPVPIVIAQHMPRLFTQSFAERLDKVSQLVVKEAEDREILRAGVALIAPGDSHLVLKRRGRQVMVEMVSDTTYIYRPSVDLLMQSTSVAYEANSAGVILTGMGNDGLAGVKELKSKGGYVIAQDEETCVVYGMPKAVVNAHLADAVLPVERIPEEIIRIL
ncbi:MAG: chemotaxis response regulator protein-glutamate methylesterase [Syntrophorhabdales bacterium]|jgi:two-component system chemotaxis response regulator CheB